MVLRHPVAKISPHVMLYLLCGSCPPDLEYLQAVDPNAASILAPWFDFIQSVRGSPPPRHPVAPEIRHLLAEYLGESVCSVHMSISLLINIDLWTGGCCAEHRTSDVGPIYPRDMEHLPFFPAFRQGPSRMAIFRVGILS
jgi:hypothetical protein